MRDRRASKLIGSDMRNSRNENLGDAREPIIDMRSDRLHHAVLSLGGFLGLGDELFPIPAGRRANQAAVPAGRACRSMPAASPRGGRRRPGAQSANSCRSTNGRMPPWRK